MSHKMDGESGPERSLIPGLHTGAARNLIDEVGSLLAVALAAIPDVAATVVKF
jgi:hypothetical protein